MQFLQGTRILDLSQYIPGPYATRQLADLGAEVIKVEPPAGDPMRQFLYEELEGDSPLYRHLNRGKRVVTLNLKEAKDREIFEKLLADADVLMESFRPGVMARLGFDRERLQQLNPRLVHCALSGFGQNGPNRLRAGHDLTYCAFAGALSRESGEPALPFPPMADHAGAMQAVSSILAALLGRSRSGEGCHLDISLAESLMSWNYIALAQPSSEKARMMLSGGAACYNVYRCADDRWIALAPLEEKFWLAFCRAVGREDWIGRQQEPLPQNRLIAELQQLFDTRPLAYWEELLEPADCCFEVIPDPGKVPGHPHNQARQLMQGWEMGYPARINDNGPMDLSTGPRYCESTDLAWDQSST